MTDQGFMPASDPVTTLPLEFAEWCDIGNNLHILNQNGLIVNAVTAMKSVNYHTIVSLADTRFAYVLLSMISNSYLKFKKEKVNNILPASLAQPLWYVSSQLGVVPVVTHACLDLWNFRKIDQTGQRIIENMEQIISFTGSQDEKYFCLVMTEIEDIGSEIYDDLLILPELIKTSNILPVKSILSKFNNVILKIIKTLDKLFVGCKPEFFFHSLRPYLAGWNDEGLVFEGVSDDITHFKGGSAGQSSLIQMFDIALGVSHISPFFVEMRKYMPAIHAQVLTSFEDTTKDHTLHQFVATLYPAEDIELITLYKECVTSLAKFRNKHYEIAHRYVTKVMPSSVKGTGGEDIKTFLMTARDETSVKAKF